MIEKSSTLSSALVKVCDTLFNFGFLSVSLGCHNKVEINSL